MKRRKGADTVYFNDHTVFMNYAGSQYSANLLFPVNVDTTEFNIQWNYYTQVIRAAVGTGYSYYQDEHGSKPWTSFWCRSCDKDKSEVKLEYLDTKKGSFIKIKIMGSGHHPTKRGMSIEDFEESVDWD
jgi:hypothetical protein